MSDISFIASLVLRSFTIFRWNRQISETVWGDWLFAPPPESGEIEQAAQDRARQQQIAERLGYMEKQYGLYSPGRLMTLSFACEPISGIRFEVSATVHSPSTERCAGNGYDAIHIKVNGCLLDTLGRINACDPVADIGVLIDDFSYRVCTSDTPAFSDGTAGSKCKSLPLSGLRQN